MRKMIFTLVLVLASSVWMTNKAEDMRLPSLCDEWNVLEFRSHMGYAPDEYNMRRYHLTTDTIIAGQRYIRLYRDNSYMGAMREGNNRDIYYIPAGTTHEYLLYAFNAQIGDELTDLWLGRTTNEVFTKEYFPYGVNATVEEITETSPRRFVLSTGYITTEEGVENYPYDFEWIEGIGFASAPDGADYPLPYAGGFTSFLLCAYKNGEQVYVSDWGEQYGCEYNQTPLLPSLCDEWNILEHFMDGGPEYESFKTLHYRLTSDTIFNGMHYVKFEQDNIYKGAMREGANADIYFVPANSTHEYLLYAFNAKIGDQLDNLWFGANEDKAFIIHSATVTDIESFTPRKFVIDFEWQHIYTYASINDTSEIIHSELIWLEGLGFQYGGPVGYTCPFDCAGSPGLSILCAYKNGEQVYVSEMGEQYGCVYNYDPFAPVDTIPLFAHDNSGSSTVDPVDPNQVVVTLKGDELTIREFSNVDVTYTLRHNSPAKMPAQMQTSASDTFRGIVTLQITESGEYQLVLTNPSWDYSIYGTFFYSPQGIEQITSSTQGGETSRLVLVNGQIYILRGEKVFTLTGQEVK
jgi:hypothetical protein